MCRKVDPTNPLYQPGMTCEGVVPYCWESGGAPKVMLVAFNGIELCPECPPASVQPPNGYMFCLKPVVGFNCWWESYENDWQVQLFLVKLPDQPVKCTIYLMYLGGIKYFEAKLVTPGCPEISPANDFICGVTSSLAGGGYAHIWYEPDNVPITLAYSYNFLYGSVTRFVRFKCGIDHQSIHLVRGQDKSSCIFLIDNQEVPEYVPP